MEFFLNNHFYKFCFFSHFLEKFTYEYFKITF